MKAIDFLAVGDTTTDCFIFLKDASVHCDINNENCTISMRWGDKIPFESTVVVPAVGNAANAAVAAARLGLSSGFVSNIGKDREGDDILTTFAKEGVDTAHVTRHEEIPTNFYYILSYNAERTILVKHNPYPRQWPADVAVPKTLYYSSCGEIIGQYHDNVVSFVEAHPDVFFGFQPGTFDIKAGIERMKRFYARADFFVCNKEEAERILKMKPVQDVRVLAESIRALGPKITIITNGRDGAYALSESGFLHLPMFPDPRPPVERTGAGDAFSSTTAAYLTLGMDLKSAMRRGLVNAASVVQDIGAQRGLLSKDELEKRLSGAVG